MSLLDDWEIGKTSTLDDVGRSLAATSFDDGQDEFPGSPRAGQDRGLCMLEAVDRHLTRGRGHVTAVAAGTECILVATSRAVLLRYHLSVGLLPVSELELSRVPDARVTGVWMDPTATHALVAVTLGSALGSTTEMYYVHAKWKKARALSKLKPKGLRFTSVAWNHAKLSEASSGPVILGSDNGKLLEMNLEEKDKKEAPVKELYNFEDVPEPIHGLEQQELPGDRSLVLVATPSRLYVFVGGPTLEALFQSYPDSAGDLRNFLHCPGESSSRGLLQTWAPLGSRCADVFSWLAVTGVQHGRIHLNLQQRPPSDLEYLALDPGLSLDTITGNEVLSMAMTQFHVLLLTARSLQVVSRISGQTVQDIPLSSSIPNLPPGCFLSLIRDAETASLFLMAGEGLYEVVMDNEERDLWRSFLDRGDFASAARYASTQAERDMVARAEADMAFESGRHVHAARLWGRIRAPEPSFEEIALRFVGVGATEALQAFLMARLQVLGVDDKAQATMVASWVVELYLDQINRALLEETAEASTSGEALAEALRGFLHDHVDVLDVNVTIGLLASYGRLDDLMHYATYRQDNESVLEYLLQRGEASKALAVLRRPGISQELVYKFAPALIAAVPAETIDAWMSALPALHPRRLMPALMRSGNGSELCCSHADALRYVEFCLSQLSSTDTTVHNLAVTLYSKEADERRLLEYLQTAKDTFGKPYYDAQFALRVARQNGRLRACVQLLCELQLHEDAVALALTFDRALASAVAARAEDDEALQRKLWLAIARHLIDAASENSDSDPRQRVAAVVEVLQEAEGRIRIEDVLPLFPDFVTIDAFKAAICASLEDYNSQIERLKYEMADATRMADALRRDMAALERQSGTLDLTEPCARCGRAIGAQPVASACPSGRATPKFYLFPTRNAFHGTCLATEVMELASPQQCSKIRSIMLRLSRISLEGNDVPNGKNQQEEDELRQTLESIIAIEDPYNGEIVVRNIRKEFVNAEENELALWQI
ncbi:Vacuolar protein sorting-associated protein 18 homolog [Coccomyxa sp. Obi]|nr:Vacuolar protein sorting-associated protein 18 homolog [Coccomyxa sp. Obi]